MTLIRNVSDTARWVAYYRAVESERPDALFHDPFARRLAGDFGEAVSRQATGGTSVARAVTVVRFLNETGKVPSSRLLAAGYGQFHPVASNANATTPRAAAPRRDPVVSVPMPTTPPGPVARQSSTPGAAARR